MKVKGRPGFSIHVLKQWDPPKFRVAWREGPLRKQRNRVVATLQAAFDLIDELASPELELRITESKVSPPKFSLFDALRDYPNRMARDRRQRKSPHIKRTIHYLERFFLDHSVVYLDDLTTELLDHYVATSAETQMSVAYMVNRIKTFLTRLFENGVPVAQPLLAYKVEKPKSKHKFSPWEDVEEEQFVKFLLSGIELIAEANPRLDLYERIRRICHNLEFRSRMRALTIFMLVSRTLTRYAELRRMIVSNWDPKEKILTLDPEHAKAEPKICLIDDEFSWVLDVLTVGRMGSELIFLAPGGGPWDGNSIGRFMQRMFLAAGLTGKLPYEIKYTGAGRMYKNPEQFTDENHEQRLARVRAITGHSAESAAVERYIKARWGNTYGAGSRYYYNNNKTFPFKVSDYPVLRNDP